MKRLIILCALFMIGCASHQKDWDSGKQRQDSYEQQRQEERIENIRNQHPGPTF